eukprot:5777037-Pleurochrysis_carterae.AAC.1
MVTSAASAGGSTSSESAAPVKSSMYTCRYRAIAEPAAPRRRVCHCAAAPPRGALPNEPPPG